LAVHPNRSVPFGAQAAVLQSQFHQTATRFTGALPHAHTQCKENVTIPMGLKRTISFFKKYCKHFFMLSDSCCEPMQDCSKPESYSDPEMSYCFKVSFVGMLA